MRIVLFVCWVVLLAGCHEDGNKTIPEHGGPKKDSKYAGILARCKAIAIDTLPVYSGGEGLNADTFRYKGILIDSTEAPLFPQEVADGMMNNFTGIYACYRFAIDDNHTGIIARTPAMYDATSIKLFTLDNEKDTLTDFTELGELWGDAGELLEKKSWLYKDNNRKLNAYIWVQESYDHSVEDEKDPTIERTDYHYVLDLSKPVYDTINRNAGALLKTFQAAARR